MISNLKMAYVRVWRVLRGAADRAGLLRWLEARDAEWALWLRSLFAIYDIDDMVHLDIPWWTLPARKEVDRFLASRPGASVFEWGSGASTIWLSKRAGTVVSVEHDREWFELMKGRTPSNVTLRFQDAPPADGRPGALRSTRGKWRGFDFADYVNALPQGQLFDLIVVDGRCRIACFELAQQQLRPGGMILFDNTGRKEYRAAVRASGLKARTFHLPSACLPYYDPTTVLTKAG